MRLSDVFDLADCQVLQDDLDAKRAKIFHESPKPGRRYLTLEESQKQISEFCRFRLELASYYIIDIEAGSVDLELATGSIICHWPGGLREELIRNIRKAIDREVADHTISQEEALNKYTGAMLAIYQLELTIADRLGIYFK